jgi:chromosomal replication initiator protein
MAPHPNLTFDRFTPTRGSRRALHLSVALAKETADAPSLLLLHGPPGVGKTHLLHAILNLRAERRPTGSLIHMGAGDLVEQWVAALRGDPGAALPLDLERLDLLVIDDLHALVGKPVTQVEVARFLEGTVGRGGRVACAMGRSPADLPIFIERLRRVPGAHVVEMRPPRGRDLRHILAVMARAGHLTLRRETLAAIADHCEGDVRRGQGELARYRFELSHPVVRRPQLTEKR